MEAPALKPESAPAPATLRVIVIPGGERLIPDSEVRIPASVVDLASFRLWASSDDFPQQGRLSYLGGELWVDLTMEQLFTHNRVKTRITSVLDLLVAGVLGYFFSDGARVSNTAADLSNEPDGVFVSFGSLQAGRIRLVEGGDEGPIELEGTPDMVLEVVSESSVRKDTVLLRQLYWRAGIPEYWLVDGRRNRLQFDILRRGRRGYVATRGQGGWLPSTVFGRLFRLTQQPDPLGNPAYTLAARAP